MQTTRIWDLYQHGIDHHNDQNLYSETERNHDFYVGDQWKNLNSGMEVLPIQNFIKPVGKYKVSMIAMNNMAIVYSAQEADDENSVKVADVLTKYATRNWENMKMDSQCWGLVKNAFIQGDHYIYFYEGRDEKMRLGGNKPIIKSKLINNTNIYLSDEQNPELQEQEYIIISERIPVSLVRDIAKQNGLSKEKIEMIIGDDDTDEMIGQEYTDEVESEYSKCTSLLYFEKIKGGMKVRRSVKEVVYEEFEIPLTAYPIIGFRWESRIGSARGISGVKTMIPNQIEANATLARRAIAVKRYAYPTLIYNKLKISGVQDLSKVGANIAINTADGNISDVIDYLRPVGISSDAETLQNELINTTRSLEGASDAATGDIDPTQTSGEAIKAARDQAAIPLNEQSAAFKQVIEDIALVWYKLWIAYGTDGLEFDTSTEKERTSEFLSEDMLKESDVSIKVDVTPIDPYSTVAQDVTLGNLLTQGYLTFEEYVNLLDSSSNVPKAKLQKLLEERKQILQTENIGGNKNEMQAM